MGVKRMGDTRTPAIQGALHQPPAAFGLMRKRLHKVLERAFERLETHAVVWLEGPPGSGKTLLAAGYLHSRPRPCRWFRAEPLTWDADLDAAFGWEAGNEPQTVVIDDLQRIAPPALATLFNRITAAPATVRFLLISRTGPPPLVKKTPVKVTVIGWRPLQLTVQEAARIAGISGRTDLPADTITRMHAASGGWVAGFTWMLARIQPAGRCTLAVRRALADYFSTMGDPPGPLETPCSQTEADHRWQVRIRTLGPFEVSPRTGPLIETRKAPKKPLELLKLLICAGEQGLTEARVIDTLWPDAEGDAGLRTLATTLHRLRALVRCDTCVVRKHGWMRLDADRVWVDAWMFEKHLDEAGDNPESIEAATGLYKGAFLEATGDPSWVLGPRDRLRGLYVRHLMHLSQTCQAQGLWEKMEAINRKGLLAEPLSEPFHQGLMTACLKQGRRTEAATAYHRCRTVLDETLGLVPSRATEAIYAQVREPG